MRKLLLVIALALTAAAAVTLGPGGWYQRGVREATARYHQAYVAAAWPAEDAGIYLGAYLKAHNRSAGGFYSMPKGGQAQVSPRLVSWGDWTRDPEWQYARIHRAGKDMALLRLSVMGELGGALLLVLLLLSRPLWYVTTGMAKLKPSKALGGAVLATWRDLRELTPTRRDAQIILGKLGRRVLALTGLEQYQSIIVVGPPRAGKSVGLFITNLLAERGPGRGKRLIERLRRRRAALTRTTAVGGRVRLDRRIVAGMLNRAERRLQRRRLRGVRSIVVTDLKGELTERTYAAMSRHHRCQVLNLVSPATSVGYNPLAHIRTALDAQVFAQTWIANTGQSSNEPFWDSAAKYLITAIVLHLNATMEGKDGGDGRATLTHVRKFLMLGSAKIMGALTDSPDEDVKEAMDGFAADLERNEKLQGSIFVELPLRFQIMADPRVQATTGRNDIDFAAMASLDAEPVALYLVLDRRMSQELKPLTACFFTQMFNAVIEIADRSPGGVLPRAILGYLDEFGNLGQIYNFPTWMTTVRSAGMGFILAVQSLSQLKKLYEDEGMKIILEACNVKIALAKTTDEDAKWFSEQTGTATVLAANAGASRKRGAVLVDHGNQGYSETSRPLLTPGEVTRLATNTLLLLSGNRPPAVVTQVRWYSKRLGLFPTRLRRLGLRRLPNGGIVPPAGPPRPAPLPIPAVAFALTAPPAVTEATTPTTRARTTPSRATDPAQPVRSAPPLGTQLQGIKRKRQDDNAGTATATRAGTATATATTTMVPPEPTPGDDDGDDWRDVALWA